MIFICDKKYSLSDLYISRLPSNDWKYLNLVFYLLLLEINQLFQFEYAIPKLWYTNQLLVLIHLMSLNA